MGRERTLAVLEADVIQAALKERAETENGGGIHVDRPTFRPLPVATFSGEVRVAIPLAAEKVEVLAGEGKVVHVALEAGRENVGEELPTGEEAALESEGGIGGVGEARGGPGRRP